VDERYGGKQAGQCVYTSRHVRKSDVRDDSVGERKEKVPSVRVFHEARRYPEFTLDVGRPCSGTGT